MTSDELKNNFYIQRRYGESSPTEIYCRLVLKSTHDNSEITRIETQINISDIGQKMENPINTFNWGNYLNQVIAMLFNMLMFRLNITDIYSVNGEDAIATFFDENPFHKE